MPEVAITDEAGLGGRAQAAEIAEAELEEAVEIDRVDHRDGHILPVEPCGSHQRVDLHAATRPDNNPSTVGRPIELKQQGVLRVGGVADTLPEVALPSPGKVIEAENQRVGGCKTVEADGKRCQGVGRENRCGCVGIEVALSIEGVERRNTHGGRKKTGTIG